MQQVLDVGDAFDTRGALDDLLDLVGPLDLTAQLDDSADDVDVYRALRDAPIAEQFAHDLLRERGVVEHRRRLSGVLGALTEPLDVGSDAPRLPLGLTRAAPCYPGDAITRDGTAVSAGIRIKE